MADPWDKRDDEKPDEYARFLAYRNLGPGRTISLALQVHLGQIGEEEGKKGKGKRITACGAWNNNSAKFDWGNRAIAWDIAQLTKQGDELARLWVGILVSAAMKAAQRLADPKCVPTTFMQALAVMDRLSPYLTPDALRTLQPFAAPSEPEQESDAGFTPIIHAESAAVSKVA